MPFNVGVPELLILAFLVLLVFGAKRLPEIGASMGKGIREFKKSLKEVQSTMDEPEELPPARRLDQAASPSERSGEPKKLSE